MDIHVSPQIERLIRDALDEDIGAGDLDAIGEIEDHMKDRMVILELDHGGIRKDLFYPRHERVPFALVV